MEKLGIIGGSGLDDPNILANPYDESVSTPYGAPSSPLKHGTIAGHELYCFPGMAVSILFHQVRCRIVQISMP